MLTIGTAGHIDHGKSSLIKALTNIDPDRLPEEKKRGITIDLGFAWLTLPSGETMGIVDVPGHKHFVSNVIPGLGGIDIALLVVAADDGWMPQTEEHAQIIDLLGIKNGIVALTKTDLVEDEDWLELVEKDIHQRLEQTTLKDAPVLQVSSRSGKGLDELKKAIEEMAAKAATRRDIAKPRLPVDRVFTMKGSGVVVTGTLTGGIFNVGEEVIISPSNITAHLRSVESYKEKLGKALPGSRVAMNLAGAKKEDIKRGDIVFAAGRQNPSAKQLDVQMRLLEGTGFSLKNNSELEVFLETRELAGRVALLDAKELKAGGKALAQLRFGEEVASYIGERFILRRQSPPQTVGGGIVLDTQAPRHRLKDAAKAVTFLKQRQKLELAELLISEAEKNQFTPAKELLAASAFSKAEIDACVKDMLKQGKLMSLSGYIVDPALWQRQADAIMEALNKEHKLHPLKEGLPQAELASRLALPRELFGQLLADMVKEELITRAGDTISLAGHRSSLSPEQEKQVKKIQSLFTAGANPPTRKELTTQLPGSEAIIHYMCQQKLLAELQGDILFESKQYATAKEKIIRFLEENGQISIQDVNSLLGYSRKYSVPLLTQMDVEGITRRQENARVLARKRPESI